MKNKPYTIYEDAVIKKHSDKLHSGDISQLLERTPSSIRRRASAIGFPITGGRDAWTDKEDALIKKMHKQYTYRQIAEKLGNRTRNAIIGRMNRLGLGKSKVTKKPVDHKKIHPMVAKLKTNFTVPLSEAVHGQCRYSQDMGADMKVCGEPVVEGTSYCATCKATATRMTPRYRG